MRTFERALRRSDLALRFTSGFNPRVRLATRQALPVGLSVRREPLAVWCSQEYQPVEIVNALNEQLPQGLQVAAGSDEAWGEVRRDVQVFEIGYDGERDQAEDFMRAWEHREEILVRRIRKGREECVDVKPHLGAVIVETGRLLVEIVARGGHFPRPGDLLAAFHQLSDEEGCQLRVYEITRL